RGQVGKRQLFAQPAGARWVTALGMLVSQARVGMKRLQCSLELRQWRMFSPLGKEEAGVIYIAAPAADQGLFIVPQGNPVGVFGKGPQRGRIGMGVGLCDETAEGQQQGKQGSEHAHRWGERLEGRSGPRTALPVLQAGRAQAGRIRPGRRTWPEP